LDTKRKIAVVGSGYVGMSLAVLLAQHNEVVVLDIDPSRVEKINKNQSTVKDDDIEFFLSQKKLSLSATGDINRAYEQADFVIVATPTNYNHAMNSFDTSSVDAVVNDVFRINKNCLVVIKSTTPIGYTKSLQEKYNTDRVIFSPEFLREGKALNDNLYPSRIIIGSNLGLAKKVANLLVEGAEKKNIETLFMSSSEAEAVKLFANTYLAMRVSFFNELDSYALVNSLDSKSIINGICLDTRIGEGYNNPSFGYGGYCLPKDTKQILANYDQMHVPQTLMTAIVSSNTTRKDFIAKEILKLNPKTVGIYRLVMKMSSDNIRSSSIIDVMKLLKKEGINIVIFEPELGAIDFFGSKVLSDIDRFKEVSDVIIANRKAECLNDVKSKCFSRDLFGNN